MVVMQSRYTSSFVLLDYFITQRDVFFTKRGAILDVEVVSKG